MAVNRRALSRKSRKGPERRNHQIGYITPSEIMQDASGRRVRILAEFTTTKPPNEFKGNPKPVLLSSSSATGRRQHFSFLDTRGAPKKDILLRKQRAKEAKTR